MVDDGEGDPGHIPVLATAAADMLVRRPDGVYVDATLGEGGHAAEILRRLGPNGRLIGIDRDPLAHELATAKLAPWSDQVTLRESTFGRIAGVLDELAVDHISGALFDLGVSSMQIDRPERGFSFRYRGPLDMRMGRDADLTAADIVNRWPEAELVRILREYGEEPRARPIARAIVGARPLRHTDELAALLGRRGRERPEKTLARVFQAIRIAVNRELDELAEGLEGALDRLEVGGRLVVISYHSLEDRLVKRWMRTEATGCICPPEQPVCTCDHVARLALVTRRVVTPDPAETAGNPRARSARMRVAERV